MVLHAKDRETLVPHSLDCLVIQVDLRDFHLSLIHTVGINRKSMILRGNRHLARRQILHWLIGA